MRRIKWSRDEYILTLNLYYKFQKGGPSKNDTEVIKCSNLLRSMNPTASAEDTRFRNANGIYLRLMNYRACDPYWLNQGKVGMKSGSKGKCKEIWEEFEGHPEEVQDLANQIALEISVDNHLKSNQSEENIIGVREGKKLLRTHYSRERKSQRKKKLKLFFEQHGKIYCEACKNEHKYYKEIAQLERIFEVHHKIALSDSLKTIETRLEDLAVLCANCHRAVHSVNPYLSVKDLRKYFDQHNV
ncbi:MAG: HNH endonuclease [Candidatus Puniceispirillales bacterium]